MIVKPHEESRDMSLGQQIREAINDVYLSFIPVERLQMRNALKYGKATGWIARRDNEPQFPWIETPKFWWES